MTASQSTTEDPHLLVVDDDERLRDLIQRYLTGNGYRVTAAPNAADARSLMKSFAFDLLVLDVMMPGESGFELTHWLRGQPGAKGRTPVLILTARDQPTDRIEGLSLGADDYLAKPFEPQELVLRIGAILRRTGAQSSAPKRLSLGQCLFDAERGELFRGEALVRLTEAEAQLLKRLARAPHAPVERHLLASDGGEAGGRAVDIQVTRLRRKIESDPKTPRYLQTVRGVGYMLAPD